MAASTMKNECRVLAGVCALVIGVYAYADYSGFMATPDERAADTYYNRLVEGFQAGQLNLKGKVPAGLAQLANPYDPNASAPYRNVKYALLDLSYYKGKLYLYFGVTPALLLLWPFAVLTGHYLYDGQAVVIFCALGFLASVGILCALRRRYFPDVSTWVVAAGALALGLATGMPMLLPRSNTNEVAISCAYMLTMLALGAIYGAFHHPERRGLWLAAASAAYGLALGARPTLVFGAIILLAPVVQAWRNQRTVWPLLLAATMPITLIGLGLMLYNVMRFDSPFEFGIHYQLLQDRQVTQQFFNWRYLWFDFRVYFLEPVRWSRRYPFARDIAVPHLPAGYGSVEHPFGILSNVPVVWLALALPLAWRGRSRELPLLHAFIATAAVLSGVCALIIDMFFWAVNRFEMEFLPTLVLLSVIGILVLERALATPGAWLAPSSEPGRAYQTYWRCAARWGWCLLLGFSVAFNLLVSVERCADAYVYAGASLQELGKAPEAMELFQHALRIDPNSAGAHVNLGIALLAQGKPDEAIRHYEEALRIDPDYAKAHINLGNALSTQGRTADALRQYAEALRINPDDAKAYYNLGLALALAGRVPEAIEQWEHALRLSPDYAEAHANLGFALAQAGEIEEAIAHDEQALRIKPDYVQAHFNLGLALEKMGRTPEAIEQYEQALKLQPDFAPAKNALAQLQNGQ
jgi:tetratricopeptide (TPR) repeat protein